MQEAVLVPGVRGQRPEQDHGLEGHETLLPHLGAPGDVLAAVDRRRGCTLLAGRGKDGRHTYFIQINLIFLAQ